MLSDEDWSTGELGEDKDDDNNKFSSSSDEVSLDVSDFEWGSYLSILILEQTLAGRPMSLSVEYQGTA